jgi:hypothetical protein
MAMARTPADLASILALIAGSQIAVAGMPALSARPSRRFDLPADFGAVEVAMLDWIVAEALHTSRVVML